MNGAFETKFKWDVFISVKRTKEGFVFYQSPQLYYWIPNHAFKSKEDTNAVTELARKHAKEFIEI